MKKIYFYMNNLVRGGAERVIIQLAKKFQEQGNEVLIITSFKGKDEYIIPTEINRLNLEKRQDFGNRLRRNVRLIKKLRRIIKKDKPDVLIGFMQEPNFRVILATLGLKTKCLISVRNDPDREYSGKLGKFIGRFVLPLADGCVFQTEEARQWFPIKLQKKSEIIYNEVGDAFFNVDYEPQKTIVTLGRLNQQKNQKMLIEAFSEIAADFPDRIVLIYGKGPLEKDLKDIIERKKLSQVIRLMGVTENVVNVLKNAEMFVLTSDYEGMPNALLEALAVGVPSIATDCPCGGPRMIIEQGENGILISPNDTKALAIQMKKILEDEALKKRLSQNAKLSAIKFKPSNVFSYWDRYIDEILKK